MSTPVIQVPTRYVLGFLFNKPRTSVVLIRKQKPAWQAGLLNGIGGKIEPGEMESEAMAREFKEETGVTTDGSRWRRFCEMTGDGFTVYCYKTQDDEAWARAATEETERVEKHGPDRISKECCVSNLIWLIELALDDNYGREFYVTARYSKPYTGPATNVSAWDPRLPLD